MRIRTDRGRPRTRSTTSASWSPATTSAATTSSALLHRAISAGRRSIIALKSARAAAKEQVRRAGPVGRAAARSWTDALTGRSRTTSGDDAVDEKLLLTRPWHEERVHP